MFKDKHLTHNILSVLRPFRAPLLTLLLAFFFACSFKQKDPGGINIQLASPNGLRASPIQDLSQTFRILSAVTPPPLNHDFRSIGDLPCFGVNVRGGTIPSSNICGGVNAGITDGTYGGVSATFHPVVPVSDGLVFEAYGTTDGSCPGLGSAYSLYRLGQVTASVSATTNTIVIPLTGTIDPTQAYSCTGSGYYLLRDSFSYAPGGLTAVAPSTWTLPAGATGITVGGAGGFLDTTDINPSQVAYWTGAVDPTKPSTHLQITQQYGNYVGAAPFAYNLGITDGISRTPSNVVGCQFQYTSGPGSVTLSTGAGTAALTPSGSTGYASAVTIPITSTNYTLSCDITVQGSNVAVSASFNDSTGTTTISTASVTIAHPCPTTCKNVFIDFEPLGYALPNGFTNFIVGQANQ